MLLACNTQTQKSEAKENEEKLADNFIVLSIEGMTCEGCENTIESNLQTLNGIVSVEASHADANAKVGIKGTEIDSAIVAQTISEAGYTLITISSE